MIKILLFDTVHTQDVINLILPIQQIEFNVPITLDMQPDLLQIPAIYQQGRGSFWVALHGDEVVGTIGLIDIGKGQACLRKMFVKATFRGKAFNIGQQLLEVVLDWCRAQQVHEIYLGTREDLHAARRFYERNGFFPVAKSELPANFPLMSVDSHFYGYRVIG